VKKISLSAVLLGGLLLIGCGGSSSDDSSSGSTTGGTGNSISSRNYVEIWTPFKEGLCEDEDFKAFLTQEYALTNLITEEKSSNIYYCSSFGKTEGRDCGTTKIDSSSPYYGTRTCVIGYNSSSLSGHSTFEDNSAMRVSNTFY